MTLPSLNILAVAVAGVLYFVIGALWYSPLLFSKVFVKYRLKPGETLEDSGNPAEYGMTLVAALIAALLLAIAVKTAGATTIVEGAVVGAAAALGLAATSSFTYTIFSGPHKMLWVIYTGYQVVAFIVMGILFVVWA